MAIHNLLHGLTLASRDLHLRNGSRTCLALFFRVGVGLVRHWLGRFWHDGEGQWQRWVEAVEMGEEVELGDVQPGSLVKRWLLDFSGQPQKSNQNHTHTKSIKRVLCYKTSKS